MAAILKKPTDVLMMVEKDKTNEFLCDWNKQVKKNRNHLDECKEIGKLIKFKDK